MTTDLIPAARFTSGVVADARPVTLIQDPKTDFVRPRINPLAVAAAACALIGFLNAAGFPAAIVLGHAAQIVIRRSHGSYAGRRLALAAALVGWVPVIAVTVTLVLVFLAGLDAMQQGR